MTIAEEYQKKKHELACTLHSFTLRFDSYDRLLNSPVSNVYEPSCFARSNGRHRQRPRSAAQRNVRIYERTCGERDYKAEYLPRPAILALLGSAGKLWNLRGKHVSRDKVQQLINER